MDIKMTIKSGSYILDLDRVKLSLGIFFSDWFNGEFFSPAFRIYVYFSQKHTQKAANFMFYQILPVAKVPWWFLGVQYIFEIFTAAPPFHHHQNPTPTNTIMKRLQKLFIFLPKVFTKSTQANPVYRLQCPCVVVFCTTFFFFFTSYNSYLKRFIVQLVNYKMISLGKVKKGHWSQNL